MEMKRRALFVAGASVGAVGLAQALKPSKRASATLVPVALAEQVPDAFNAWSLDRALIPLTPNPALQATLDKIYGQVLARTYVDGQGRRVMLSIAYGEDQGTDATAAHRPEFCYSAQGFAVDRLGDVVLDLADRRVSARRLLGRMGPRFEPITYWVTLNDSAVLPGIERKLQQIRIGLSGSIPDGMLVRTSTVGLPLDQSFAIQERFLADLATSMPEQVRSRYFGQRRRNVVG